MLLLASGPVCGTSGIAADIAQESERHVSVMSKVGATAALIVGIALALFGAHNQDRVALHFLWFTARALRASIAVLAAGLLGVLVGVCSCCRVGSRAATRRGG